MKHFTKLALCVCLLMNAAFAQNSAALWHPVKQDALKASSKVRRNSFPNHAFYYQLDLQKLKSMLVGAPVRGQLNGKSPITIQFPMADGSFEKFAVMESPIMHPELAAKYPMIKTYAAQGIDDPTATMRFSITQFGLNTMTLSGKHSTNYIDPYTSDRVNYIVYDKASLAGTPQNFECLLSEEVNLPSLRNDVSNSVFETNDQILRTYRLALSCTAEYGNIFATTPGTEVADIQAQMTISMNRVNGVYERDLAITMEFIPNNDLLIFYGNTGSDPWSNEWNTTTAQVIDNTIGVANYDIGHNFNTTGGGNAGCIACVCTSTSQSGEHKGRGFTGSSNPTGDAFDIDYVAHEMGHQYGGYHTMNTCSRSGSGNTEVEPASGSSIMAYAGICSSNVQAHSDDDFNYVNVRDISANVQTGNSTCAFQSPLTNQPPTASAGPDFTIPKGTAFVLEGIANDPDGNASLTYNWSQNDPEQSPGNAAPQSTYNVGPMYRCISPQLSPNRYMPNLRTVVLNSLANTWEVTPTVARTMDFSFIVRDNDVTGGQTASDLMTVTVDNAGPFVVTSQNTATTWNAGANETVTWNVAGTNAGNVNCANVNIYLSLDSGYTYPYTIATNVPNNGSASVTVPVGVTTTTGRIMVRGAGNIFYALNTQLITIQASEFVMSVANTSQGICPPGDVTYNFTYNTFLSFNETTTFSATGLPAGATATFNPATATNDGTPVTMTISGLTAAMVGNNTITITGTSTSVTKSTDVTLSILDPALTATVLTSPANAATGVNSIATLTWTPAASSGVTYSVEVASDAAFATIVSSASGLSSPTFQTSVLAVSSTYYWRVTASNGCSADVTSNEWSFTTNSCSSLPSADVPVTVSDVGTPTVTSTLAIPITGTITDVNVIGLIGTHSWIADLTFTISGPTGASSTLFANTCFNEDNYDCSFDDAAAAGALPCPPVGGGIYQPATPLSVFNGTAANGTWTLTVDDAANQDGGDLTGWGLEICTNSSVGVQTYFANNSFNLFPNPTNGIINISKTGKVGEKYTLKITNSIGQLLISQTVSPNTDYKIDLSNQSSGLYFVTLVSDHSSETQKVTITNN
jgi:subtilisin-like proprotein convertase family protein